jgi:hypothetical protein
MNTTFAWQEYCKTLAPRFQAACRRMPVSGDPEAIVRTLEQEEPEWPFHHRLNRGGWYRLGGVVDAGGGRISDNLGAWAEAALAANGGDFARLLEMLEETPLYATRLTGGTHYLVARTGETPAEFLQLEIEELQEMRAWRLGRQGVDEEPASLAELIDLPGVSVPPDRLEAIGQRFFNFRRVLHVGALLERLSAQSTEPLPIQRFLADWQNSSANLQSAFSMHWVIAFREFLDRYRQTQYRALPLAVLSGKPPAFTLAKGTTGLGLHTALQTFDREAGYAFAWFFHMLVTRAVPHWVAQAVVEDALNDFAYLPKRDVDIVRHWLHTPYAL